MATIRRSGSGWQVLIRTKNYVGPKSRTFLSRDLAESWADAVEGRTKKVLNDIPARQLRVRGTGDERAPFLTNEDEKRLLFELSQMSNPNHLRLTKLALATGFRRSELLSLTWRNIDLKKKLLYI